MPADGGSPLAERQNLRCSYLVYQRYFAAGTDDLFDAVTHGRFSKSLLLVATPYHAVAVVLHVAFVAGGVASNLWLLLLV